MPTRSEITLPKPLSAYVGLLAASIEDARATGRSAVAQVARLPLAAAGQLLTARRRYDELAEHGDEVLGEVIDDVIGLVGRRFGSGAEEDGDWIGDEFAADRAAGAITSLVGAGSNGVTFQVTPAEDEPTPIERIERFSVPAEIGAEAGGLKTAADLPVADFDHMTGPQLRGRLRVLNQVQLVQLLDYERAHANRVGIVLMLENRISKLLAAEEGRRG